jgi:dihydrolipoamide dehydrogenase
VATTEYDVIVIGGGPGGYTAAIRAAQLGQKTAVVEMDSRLGGTCLLRGCIPTKALLHSADLVSEFAAAGESGIRIKDLSVDFPAVMKNKSQVVEKNAAGVEYLFKKNKITTERGRGRLVDASTVDVTEDGKSRRLSANRGIILAMGSQPTPIGAFPVDGKRILNSDHILDLEKLPKSLAVLGAGAVGTEFASIYARLGVETTLIEMMDRILPIEDAEVSKELERALKKDKIDVRAGTKLNRAEVAGSSVKLELEKQGKTETREVEQLLVAVGRSPLTADCGLEETGVAMDRAFVVVDEYMRTSVPGVWAIGDIVPTPMLAHCASAEGIVAAESIAGHDTFPVKYATVPNATYCRPEVASVGLTEEQAKDEGYEVAVGKFPWMASGKARIKHQTAGFIKIVREKEYDEILGIHIIGPGATDLISEAVALLHLECTNEELSRIVHAHPTLAEGMLEASHAAAGHPIAF